MLAINDYYRRALLIVCNLPQWCNHILKLDLLKIEQVAECDLLPISRRLRVLSADTAAVLPLRHEDGKYRREKPSVLPGLTQQVGNEVMRHTTIVEIPLYEFIE